jgi:uncharacterized protein
MEKIYLNDDEIKKAVMTIIHDLTTDQWTPDYIIGLTRGGLYPARLISAWYNDLKMDTLKVQLRDGDSSDCDHGHQFASDAYAGKNILIVDDINDSGATLQWIKDDWKSISLFGTDEEWDDIWGNNLKVAAVVDCLDSSFAVDYSGVEIDKSEINFWVVFPWEEWWT